MGCDAAQGWYFGRPLSPALATAWLAQHATGDHDGHRVPAARRPAQLPATRAISIPRPAGPPAPPPAPPPAVPGPPAAVPGPPAAVPGPPASAPVSAPAEPVAAPGPPASLTS
jgi:hypothetical protein